MTRVRHSGRRVVRLASDMSARADSLGLLPRPSVGPGCRTGPTWPGLSETRNGRGITPCPGNSSRLRTPASPDTNPPPQQKRPEMDRSTQPQVPAGRQDLQERPPVGPGCRTGPTWPGLFETRNGRGITPCPGNSSRLRTPASPDTSPPLAQERSGMDKYALIQIPPGRWDLQGPGTFPGCRIS